MKKPREFWIKNMEIVEIDEAVFYKASNEDMIRAGFVLVREVIEVSEAEIGTTSEKFVTNAEPLDQSLLRHAFEAGARWAIARLTGASDE